VGVGQSTVLQWLQRGEGRSPRGVQTAYVEFVEAITRAKAVDEARRIARLEQAGRGGAVVHEKTTTFADGRVVVERTYAPPDWKADAFVLERRYADRWGRTLKADLRLEVQQMVAEVAAEFDLTPEALMEEAQRFIAEHDARRR